MLSLPVLLPWSRTISGHPREDPEHAVLLSRLARCRVLPVGQLQSPSASQADLRRSVTSVPVTEGSQEANVSPFTLSQTEQGTSFLAGRPPVPLLLLNKLAEQQVSAGLSERAGSLQAPSSDDLSPTLSEGQLRQPAAGGRLAAAYSWDHNSSRQHSGKLAASTGELTLKAAPAPSSARAAIAAGLNRLLTPLRSGRSRWAFRLHSLWQCTVSSEHSLPADHRAMRCLTCARAAPLRAGMAAASQAASAASARPTGGPSCRSGAWARRGPGSRTRACCARSRRRRRACLGRTMGRKARGRRAPQRPRWLPTTLLASLASAGAAGLGGSWLVVVTAQLKWQCLLAPTQEQQRWSILAHPSPSTPPQVPGHAPRPAAALVGRRGGGGPEGEEPTGHPHGAPEL